MERRAWAMPPPPWHFNEEAGGRVGGRSRGLESWVIEGLAGVESRALRAGPAVDSVSLCLHVCACNVCVCNVCVLVMCVCLYCVCFYCVCLYCVCLYLCEFEFVCVCMYVRVCI